MIRSYAWLVSVSALIGALVHFVHHYVLFVDAYMQAMLAAG